MKKLALICKIAAIITDILLIVLLVWFIKDYRELALEEISEASDTNTAQV